MGEKSSYIDAVCKELVLRKDYLSGETIKTIYFGGGTPSQLSRYDFETIFSVIHKHYSVVNDAEITIEANPDDLTGNYIKDLRSLPFNRISIGIQSFNDNDLTFLNRRHSAERAKEAVRLCKDEGFDNISIDLIYGLPNQTPELWQRNLEEAITLDIQHISAYHLIYEEDTKLYDLLQKGKVNSVDEEISVKLFSQMREILIHSGFEHYEISNFAKGGFISKHNSSYWHGEKYLGTGPAAHSYNGESRSWNVSSISKYINAIKTGIPLIESEQLSLSMRYNDYILTRMRTKWGADLKEIETAFGHNMLEYCLQNVKRHISNKDVTMENNSLIISEKGMLISDGIMSDLMYIDKNNHNI